jgi:AcrR family transcriptional regulator
VANHNGPLSEDPGKRLAILDQAIRTFAELGYRGADVQVIADRAGVGKGTVYRYFHSKEDLFWATTYEVLLRMEQHVFRAVECVEGACDKLRASAAAYADFFLANPQYLELFVQDLAEFRGSGPESHRQHREKMFGHIDEILRQGIQSGELRPIDTRHTTFALGGLLFGATVLGSHLKWHSMAEMTNSAVDIFLQGIVADPLFNSRELTAPGMRVNS